MTRPIEPTPAELRELAARADTLARDVAELHGRRRASGDLVRRTGFRLEDITGELGRVSAGLADTASDLARVRVSHDDGRLCQAEWGVCPEHGNTLTSTGGTSVCRIDRRTWNYDRPGSPCGEPVTDLVTDPTGASTPMCHGHALALPAQDGWSVRSIAETGG